MREVPAQLAHNSGSPTDRQRYAIYMAYRWRVVGGPTMYALWDGPLSHGKAHFRSRRWKICLRKFPTRTCLNQPAQLQRQAGMLEVLYEVSLRIIHVLYQKRISKVLTRLHGRLVCTFVVRLQQSQVFSSRGPSIDMKKETEHAQISKSLHYNAWGGTRMFSLFFFSFPFYAVVFEDLQCNMCIYRASR